MSFQIRKSDPDFVAIDKMVRRNIYRESQTVKPTAVVLDRPAHLTLTDGSDQTSPSTPKNRVEITVVPSYNDKQIVDRDVLSADGGVIILDDETRSGAIIVGNSLLDAAYWCNW